MTGTAEGLKLLLAVPEILRQLTNLTQDKSIAIAKDAMLSLVNVSADVDGARALLTISESSGATNDSSQMDNLVDICIR